jgi:hypothetical protein
MFASLAFLLLTTFQVRTTPDWEPIFEVHGGRDVWISAIRAKSRDEWTAAGSWGVSWNTATGVQRRETPGPAVLGLFADAETNDVFALGAGELVLRFDGKDWVQEHVGPKPNIVYSGLRGNVAGKSTVIAWGLWLVLVRQPDGTWVLPQESERQKLSDLGQGGRHSTYRAVAPKPDGFHWAGTAVYSTATTDAVFSTTTAR